MNESQQNPIVNLATQSHVYIYMQGSNSHSHAHISALLESKILLRPNSLYTFPIPNTPLLGLLERNKGISLIEDNEKAQPERLTHITQPTRPYKSYPAHALNCKGVSQPLPLPEAKIDGKILPPSTQVEVNIVSNMVAALPSRYMVKSSRVQLQGYCQPVPS